MDLISRQAAIDAMATWDWQEMYLPIHFKQLLEELPAAQPEIIRCKDCKYGSPNGVYGCRLERFSVHDESIRLFTDDYCSVAERRE